MDKKLKDLLSQPAIQVAPKLLGAEIARQTLGGEIRLKIVEVEAYAQDDPASHSAKGLTKRTAPMFESAGHLYVYFTYGLHYCVNIVVGEKGRGEAVLLRAAEPIGGLDIIKQNRGLENIYNLANGPAKLAQALGIYDTNLSGSLLSKNTFQIMLAKKPVPKEKIIAGPRIGVSQAVDQAWRFYLRDSRFVSRL